MNKVIRRTLQGAALAGGIVLASSAAAQANLSDSVNDNGALNNILNHSVNGDNFNGNSVLDNNKTNVDAPIAVGALDGEGVAVDGQGRHHSSGSSYSDLNAGGSRHYGSSRGQRSVDNNGLLNNIGNHSLNGDNLNCNSILDNNDTDVSIPIAVGSLEGEGLAV
ncbi:MAG: hypothetical protein ACR2JX_09745 [Mycobacteriales bacterium]